MAIKRLKSIRSDKWYIVDLFNATGKPLLLWNEFDDESDAITALFRKLAHGMWDRWIAISGEEALKHRVKVWGYKEHYNTHYIDSPPWINVFKYRYPPNCNTWVKRKRFRDKIQKLKKYRNENRNL